MGFNPYRVFKLAATYTVILLVYPFTQFQSLSGFQARCNLKFRSPGNVRSKGFNPYRVFKLAATKTGLYTLHQGEKVFQSLSGFQARCNRILPLIVCISTLFQSLSGFQARCNISSPASGKVYVLRFNPYRVFKLAATEIATLAWTLMLLFQSLSGFQARCNILDLEIVASDVLVSIPIGFSSSLQRSASQLDPRDCTDCFNPYRVFKLAATQVTVGAGVAVG